MELWYPVSRVPPVLTRVPGKRDIQLTVLCTFVVVVYNHPQHHPGDIGGGAKGRVSGGGRSPAGRCRSGGREEPTSGSAPTAAEIKAALEENRAMLQELGLAWVRNASEISHAFQLPPHVTALSARVVADLEKALATAEAEAAVHAATIREAARPFGLCGKMCSRTLVAERTRPHSLCWREPGSAQRAFPRQNGRPALVFDPRRSATRKGG